MDYIEEYLKHRLQFDNIHIDNYVVNGDKIQIEYFIIKEPYFATTTWTYDAIYDKYIEWEKIYLRKRKINKIKYGLYSTNPTT